LFIATVSNQRSGTKLLGSLLGSSGIVLPVGEIFNPDVDLLFSFKSFLKLKGLDAVFSQGSEPTITEYFNNINHLKDIVHFDLMFNQLEYTCLSWSEYAHPFMYSHMKNMRFFVILLTRDPMEIFISNKILELTGLPHTYESEEDADEKRHVLDLKRSEFDSFRTKLAHHYSLARSSFTGYPFFYEIDYGELQTTGLPSELFALMRVNAHFFENEFDWQSFPPQKTKLKKTMSQPEIRWHS